MKSHILGSFGTFSIAALMLAGCGSADAEVGNQITAEIRSDVPRSTDPAPDPDVKKLAIDNAAFGMELFHAVNPDGNFVDSPHSISIALAMTYAGARATTHDEMARVMHYTLDEPALHAAFDTVDLALNNRPSDLTQDGKRPFKLHVANSVWGHRDMKFESPYLDVLAKYYGAGLRRLDFENDTEAARQTINTWVSDRTEAKIPELLSPEILQPDTKLVLTNAIYFLGSWESPFEQSRTRDGEFHKLNGETVSVPMMHGDYEKQANAYAEGDGWQAAELRYVGEQVSMVLLLPAEGQFQSFQSSLDGPKLTSILDQLGSLPKGGLLVTLPKFQARWKTDLKAPLIGLGMATAFDEMLADFSGMSPAGLHIGNVIHECMIRVDEAGTEAAAATAVRMVPVAAPVDSPQPFTADRPFLFAIRDKPTGTVLFVGQILDPSATGE